MKEKENKFLKVGHELKVYQMTRRDFHDRAWSSFSSKGRWGHPHSRQVTDTMCTTEGRSCLLVARFGDFLTHDQTVRTHPMSHQLR